MASIAVAVPGCAAHVVAPEASLDGLPEGLRVELVVEPNVVAAHESFTARLTVTNTTMRTIRVITSHGCLVIPHVMRDGTRVPFHGSSWMCTAAITPHSFEPGQTIRRSWEMRAELYAEHPGDVEGAPALPGIYRVQAEFDTAPVGGQNRKPVIERTLLVR